MKKYSSLISILFLLTIYSCTKKSELSKVWISASWVQQLESRKLIELKKDKTSKNFEKLKNNIYTCSISDKLIFDISENQIELTHFNESRYDGFTKTKYNYEYANDSIKLFSEFQKGPIYKIEYLNKDELIIQNLNEHSFLQENRIQLYQMPIFEPSIKYEAIKSFLNEAKFTISNSNIEIFFTVSNRYCGDILTKYTDKKYAFENGAFWCLSKLKNEIILQIGSEIFQIMSLENETLVSLKHGLEKEKVYFNKIYEKKFITK